MGFTTEQVAIKWLLPGWMCVCGQVNHLSRSQCVTVNGLNSHADIANAFADNFATVCQHNSISHNESLKCEFHDKFPTYCKTFANGGCLLSSDQV